MQIENMSEKIGRLFLKLVCFGKRPLHGEPLFNDVLEKGGKAEMPRFRYSLMVLKNSSSMEGFSVAVKSETNVLIANLVCLSHI